jgi:hypothetical protein
MVTGAGSEIEMASRFIKGRIQVKDNSINKIVTTALKIRSPVLSIMLS